MDDREQYINFDEYIRQGESQKRERADAWRVAIGLQAVDGLKTLAAIHRAIFEPPEDWKMPESEQAENKHRTSTEQVAEQVRTLVLSIGKDQLTLKQMMEKMNLKHRPNFIDNYLNPAIADGYIRLLYPQSPHHPRQKYLLTVKGLALYNE